MAVVREGCAHPNAAKLVAVYTASPAGAKWTWEEADTDNMYYGFGVEGELFQRAIDRGIPINYRHYPDLVEFTLSAKAEEWAAEADAILKGG